MSRQLLSELKTALYRKPWSELRRLRTWGANAYFNIGKWKQQMEVAAGQLPTASEAVVDSGGEGEPVTLWFLTGRDFWYQTAFCAWTFACQSGREVEVNLVDDGSLGPDCEGQLRRIFPRGKTVWYDAVKERLEDRLPQSQYPMLHKRWDDYVNIRKLTDVHLGEEGGWKLVLDSDMLFFSKPEALLKWWDERNVVKGGPICLMRDSEESYGYTRGLMEELAGEKIGSRLNVGVCGLRSDDVDWEQLEAWCAELHAREGTCYYLEQALVAMLAAKSRVMVLPEADYITYPTRSQVQSGEGVLQHYVSDSKPWYFGEAWKLALNALPDNGEVGRTI